MFAIIKDNTFIQFLAAGSPFSIDDTQYPANWLNLSTPEEKAALGIVDVVRATRPDDRYYWVSESAPVYADGVVTVDYVATPKDLASLKAAEESKINAACFALLVATDLMDFRPNYTPPAGWLEWRQSMRDTAKAAKAAVNACESVEALAALAAPVWPQDPDHVTP
jgi:hypothetical protein